jgi:alpha-L-fucosidase
MKNALSKANRFSQLLLWTVIGLTSISLSARAQHSIDGYFPETDPLVQQKLAQWQDLKFGLFMHWGAYSVWGIEASWPYCAEDMGWNPRKNGRYQNYEQYKEDYRNLQKVFNPTKFNPAKWARAAKAAGMRYVVLTTKHHDGFCMFDTKTTEYKITGADCPFHTDPRSNITKETFNAFRNEGFMVGAYFSKADWHCGDYWWPYFATPDRHVNYDPAKYPDRWKKFKDFTYTQIEELMTGYGSVDVLWLDGGWVRPNDNIPKRFEEWAKKGNWNQDIDIPRIAAMARSHQPGLMIVDRTVAGKYENYVTPEGSVPAEPISVPWETCMMMGMSQWTYSPNETFRPAHNLIHMLVDNVSKGGNLLLDIGPSPEGEWPDSAYQRLEEIGAWMKVNDEAIYATRFMMPFKEGNIRFIQKKNGGAVYAVYLAAKDEIQPPEQFRLTTLRPAKGATVTMLGVKGNLTWKNDGNGCTIEIPGSVRTQPPCLHAWTVRISEIDTHR